MKRQSIPNSDLLTEVSELLKQGKQVTLKPKGNSMLPFIVGGKDSTVLSKKKEYNRGDIVLAEIELNKYVLHRVIKIINNEFILRGDGNLNGIEKCNRSDIKGYVTEIYKKNRKINCNNRKEQLNAKVWNILFPIRRYLLTIYKRIN